MYSVSPLAIGVSSAAATRARPSTSQAGSGSSNQVRPNSSRLAAEADGLRLGQSLVGVGHQRDIGADRLAHRADAGDVGGGVRHPQAHLHGSEALRQEGLRLLHQFIGGERQPQAAAVIRRHAVLGAAEQAVERQSGGLAEGVPQRTVNGGNGHHRHALVAEEIDVLPGARPEAGDVAGILADDHIRQVVHHLAQHLGAPVMQGEHDVLAGDPLVGADRHQDAS